MRAAETNQNANNPLLLKILAIEAGRIFKPKIIETGLEYLDKELVGEFIWKAENILCAVLGSTKREIYLALLQNGSLDLKCPCPSWGKRGQCPHVAGVFITIQHLLSDKWIDQASPSPAWTDFLKAQLLRLNSDDEGPEIGLEISGENLALEANPVTIVIRPDKDSGITIRLKYDKSLIHPYSRNLPKVLHHLKNPKDGDSETALLQFLNETSYPYILIIKTTKGNLEAKWNPELEFMARTELDLRGNQVCVRKVGVASEQRNISKFIRIGKELAFDFESSAALFRIKNKHDWNLAEHLNKTDQGIAEKRYVRDVPIKKKAPKKFSLDTGNCTIPLTVFNKQVLKLQTRNSSIYHAHLVFFKNQKEVTPKFVNPKFEIRFSKKPIPGERMDLVVNCIMSGEKQSFSHPAYQALKILFRRPDKAVQRKKHRILNAMLEMALLSSQSERMQFMERKLQTMHEWHRPIIKPVLEEYAQVLEREPYRQLLISGKEWQIGVWDLRKCHKVFALLNQRFGTAAVMQLLDDRSVEVLTADVYKCLVKLQRSMAELEADLFINHQPVRPARIDITINAKKAPGQNWFDIPPEIRIDEKLLSDEELQAAVKNSGLLEKADAIYLLQDQDIQTLENLKQRKSLLPFRKNIVEIKPLLIFEVMEYQKLGIKVQLSEEDEKLMQGLLNSKGIEERNLPEKFCGTLLEHQKFSYSWIGFRYECRLGACLADDSGLGKTVETINFLGGIKEGKLKSISGQSSKGPHLIVVLPTLLSNWKKEIEKFYPELKTVIYAGNSRRLECFQGADIVLTSYDIVEIDIETFEKIHFHCLVFDEAQKIKNIYAARTNVARRLKGDFKLCLTATPVENHIGEYFAIMDLCVPGLLDKGAIFKKDHKVSSQDFLIERTRPFVLRRTKEILKGLPEKTEHVVYLEMTDSQKLVYTIIAKSAKEAIALAYAQNDPSRAGIIAVQQMLKLRKVSVAEELINSHSTDRSPKMAWLIKKAKELQESNEAGLVFSNFRTALNILERELQKEKISYYRMDGKTPIEQRQSIIDSFQNQNGPTLFLTTRGTGGVGLNLTRANHVLHMEPWWNPAVDRQASDRVHRIGQEKPVHVYYPIMDHTIEKQMMILREAKKELFEAVLDSKHWQNAPTKADIDFLLAV